MSSNSTIDDSSGHQDSSMCAVCGISDMSLVVFYLRSQSVRSKGRTVMTKSITYKAHCCSACFQNVSRLQTAYTVVSILGFGPLLLVGLLLLVNKSAVTGPMLAIPFIIMILGLIGLIYIAKRHKQLLKTEYFLPAMQQIKAVHSALAADSPMIIISLATLSKGQSTSVEIL